MRGPGVVVGNGTYKLLGAINISLDEGKFIVAWKMENGAWKSHGDMFTASKAPPMH